MLRCCTKVLTRGCLLLTRQSVATTSQQQFVAQTQTKYNSLDWHEQDVLDHLPKVKRRSKNIAIESEQQSNEDKFLKAALLLLTPDEFDDLSRCIRKQSEIGGTLGINKLVEKVLSKLYDMFRGRQFQEDCPLNKLVDLLEKCSPLQLSRNHNLYASYQDKIDDDLLDTFEKSGLVDTACRNIFSTRKKFKQDISFASQMSGYDKITPKLEIVERPRLQVETISSQEMQFNKKLQQGNFQRKKLNKISKQIEKRKEPSKQQKAMQSPYENITIERIGRDSIRPTFGSNWVYVYDLPYELHEQVIDKLKNVLQNKYGSVRNILRFPFSQIIEKQSVVPFKKMHLPEEMELTSMFGEEHMVQINNFFENVQVNSQQKKPEQKQPQSKKKDRAKQMQQTITKNKFKHLNKSHLLLQLESEDVKQRLLSPEMRLFGIHIEDSINSKFQCAMEKKSLQLRNIPWGITIGELVEAINDALKNHDVQFRMEHDEPQKILTKGTVSIGLNSFYEAMITLNALADLRLRQYKMKSHLRYGGLYSFAGQVAQVRSGRQKELIKQRLMNVFETRVEYSNRMNEAMQASAL